MQTQVVQMQAVGVSPWVVTDNSPANLAIDISCQLSTFATLTYSVEHTLHNLLYKTQQFSVSRTGTVATVTYPGVFTNPITGVNGQFGHGLVVGDWVMEEGTDSNMNGQFEVGTVPTALTFTYGTSLTVGATVNALGSRMAIARVLKNPTINNLTVSAEAQYSYPIRAVRLRCSAYTSGVVTMLVNQGTRA